MIIGVVNAQTEATIRLSVRPFAYSLSVATAERTMQRATAISPGDGWRLLTPFERSRGRWAPVLDGGWMMALLFPLGYFAGLRSPAAALAAAAAATAYLLLLPAVTGCARLPLIGWCGAMGGFAVGLAATHWIPRTT